MLQIRINNAQVTCESTYIYKVYNAFSRDFKII